LKKKEIGKAKRIFELIANIRVLLPDCPHKFIKIKIIIMFKLTVKCVKAKAHKLRKKCSNVAGAAKAAAAAAETSKM